MPSFLEVVAPWLSAVRLQEKKQSAEQERKTERMRLEQERIEAAQREEFERVRREEETVERMRARVNSRLTDLEKEAITALSVLEKSRKVLATPVLTGDPVLIEAEQELADLEAGVVEVQTLISIDPGSMDTAELGRTYTSIQSGIVAVNAIAVRAAALANKLSVRANEIEAERSRARRIREREIADAERIARQEEQDRERRGRMNVLTAIRELDGEIEKEKRLISQLRYDIRMVEVRKAEELARLARVAM